MLSVVSNKNSKTHTVKIHPPQLSAKNLKNSKKKHNGKVINGHQGKPPL